MRPSIVIDWETVIPANSPKFLVDNTVLERGVPRGFLHRFVIETLRMVYRDEDGKLDYDFKYQVRDAHTVSDAAVAAGMRPSIVFKAYLLEAVEEWLLTQR